MAVSLTQAARVEAARYLAAQWFVPAVMVPRMIVCHVMALRSLIATHRSLSGPAPNQRLHPSRAFAIHPLYPPARRGRVNLGVGRQARNFTEAC